MLFNKPQDMSYYSCLQHKSGMSFYKPLTFSIHLNNEDANTTNEKQQVIVLILHWQWSIKLNQSFLSNHYYQRYLDPQKTLVSTLFFQFPRNIHFNHKNTNTVISLPVGEPSRTSPEQRGSLKTGLLSFWSITDTSKSTGPSTNLPLRSVVDTWSYGRGKVKKGKTQFLAATVCKQSVSSVAFTVRQLRFHTSDARRFTS